MAACRLREGWGLSREPQELPNLCFARPGAAICLPSAARCVQFTQVPGQFRIGISILRSWVLCLCSWIGLLGGAGSVTARGLEVAYRNRTYRSAEWGISCLSSRAAQEAQVTWHDVHYCPHRHRRSSCTKAIGTCAGRGWGMLVRGAGGRQPEGLMGGGGNQNSICQGVSRASGSNFFLNPQSDLVLKSLV